jgi:hypothetical protein
LADAWGVHACIMVVYYCLVVVEHCVNCLVQSSEQTTDVIFFSPKKKFSKLFQNNY